MDREPWQAYSPWGHKESDATEHLTHTFPLGTCPSSRGGQLTRPEPKYPRPQQLT